MFLERANIGAIGQWQGFYWRIGKWRQKWSWMLADFCRLAFFFLAWAIVCGQNGQNTKQKDRTTRKKSQEFLACCTALAQFLVTIMWAVFFGAFSIWPLFLPTQAANAITNTFKDIVKEKQEKPNKFGIDYGQNDYQNGKNMSDRLSNRQ